MMKHFYTCFFGLLLSFGLAAQTSMSFRVTHFPGGEGGQYRSREWTTVPISANACWPFLSIRVMVKYSGYQDKPYLYKVEVTNNSNYRVSVDVSNWGFGSGGSTTLGPGRSSGTPNPTNVQYPTFTIKSIQVWFDRNTQATYGAPNITDYFPCGQSIQSYLNQKKQEKDQKEKVAQLQADIRAINGDEIFDLQRKLGLYRELDRLDQSRNYSSQILALEKRIKGLEDQQMQTANKIRDLKGKIGRLGNSREDLEKKRDYYRQLDRLDEENDYSSEIASVDQELNSMSNGSSSQGSSSSGSYAGNSNSSSRSSSNQSSSSSSSASRSSSSSGSQSSASTQAQREQAAQQKRVEEYNRKQQAFEQQLRRDQQARQAHNEAMAELGMAAILVHYMIGQVIYSGIGYDSNINLMDGPGNRIGATIGYQLVMPNPETFSIEMGGSFDYWQYHSEEAGLAAGVEAFAGHGLVFDQFTYGTAFRMQGFLGAPELQVYGSYQLGLRAIDYTGDDQDAEVNHYHRFMAGPQFRFNTGYQDWSTLRVLGVFEKSNRNIVIRNELNGNPFQTNPSPTQGALFNYTPGFRVEWNKRNRISLGAEALFTPDWENDRYMFYVHRRLDQFPNSALRLKNYRRALRAINNYSGSHISVMQTSMGWVQNDSSGVINTDPILGVRPVGYQYIFPLYKNLALQAGLETRYDVGRFNHPVTNVNNRVHRLGLTAPLTLRLYMPYTFTRYHIEAGLSYTQNLLDIGERRNDGSWETDGEYQPFLEESLRSYRLGIGASFPGANNNHSVSLIYESSFSPYYQSFESLVVSQAFPNAEATRLHNISIQLALQL